MQAAADGVGQLEECKSRPRQRVDLSQRLSAAEEALPFVIGVGDAGTADPLENLRNLLKGWGVF